MSGDFSAADERVKRGLELVDEEIRKLEGRMESYRLHDGPLYTELPLSLNEIRDTQEQLRIMKLFRERLLHNSPWLDSSRQIALKPPKVSLC